MRFVENHEDIGLASFALNVKTLFRSLDYRMRNVVPDREKRTQG